MTRFVAQHPFIVGAVLVSGPMGYCIGSLLLGWLGDTSGHRNVALPLIFILLWLGYMAAWVYLLLNMTKSDRRRGFPVSRQKSNRFTDRFSHFDPHSN